MPQISATGRPLFATLRLHGASPTTFSACAGPQSACEHYLAQDHLLDQTWHGPTLLNSPAVADAILQILFQGVEIEYYQLHSWVLMPNHMHLLLTPHVNVSRCLGSLKTAIAKQVNRLLQRPGLPFWQQQNFEYLVRNDAEFRKLHTYIQHNPVAAGLALAPEEYLWSSAGHLATKRPYTMAPASVVPSLNAALAVA